MDGIRTVDKYADTWCQHDYILPRLKKYVRGLRYSINVLDDSYMAIKSNRGFAAMDRERQRQIARLGGKAAHERGTAHRFSSDEARAAGRKGGETVSKNRAHMASIGRKGGEAVSKNRRHMAEIGRRGGQRRGTRRMAPA